MTTGKLLGKPVDGGSSNQVQVNNLIRLGMLQLEVDQRDSSHYTI
jgi:hypothetical protein